ncbi:transporter substrate-binding domain-containing protein [Alteromonas sp. C1M14]|uniref:transporter substrate-binding domain-containing protein n=1 Tax=Alteromonas sp. C1M14 TaxID=2841567 RepID=UPI001C084A44|nr:transporter substrate-binding domain-containing protein [Alteromonas sp. C1M14]MBU2979824.1 transporter substrate-binding domain-containing protein [Alteromonas sp. C1M14]
MNTVIRLLTLSYLLMMANLGRAETFIIGAQDIHYYPHYDFTSQRDKGLAWAILQAFAKHSGHEFIYHAMPIVRLQRELKKGSIDFVYPDNPAWYNPVTAAKDKYFSLPIVEAFGGTVVQKSHLGLGMDQIKYLGIPKGFTPVNWQQRIEEKQIHVVHENNIKNLLFYAQTGKVQAVNLEFHVMHYYASRVPELTNLTLDLSLPHNNVGFMLSTINHPALLQQFNGFLQNHQALIEKIKQQYDIKSRCEVIAYLSNTDKC